MSYQGDVMFEADRIGSLYVESKSGNVRMIGKEMRSSVSIDEVEFHFTLS